MTTRRSLAAIALIFGAVVGVPGADAAPYVASCNRGVVAPQLCTFLASTVTAAYAAPGQHVVLAPVRPQRNPGCPEDTWAHVESYSGRLRTAREIVTVRLDLAACPGAHPQLMASIDFGDPAHAYAVYHPPTSSQPARISYSEGYLRYTNSGATGNLFRRDTGMGVRAVGTTSTCASPTSGGLCESERQEYRWAFAVDSSVSGHWARLQLRIDAHDGDRAAHVAAQPYGSFGWKITRTA